MTPREMVDALSPVVKELRALRASVERVAAALAPPPEPEPETACAHPSDQRIPFGRTNGAEDWQCGACGYRVSEAKHV